MRNQLFTYLLFISALIVTACADDDSFSTSSANHLTFTTDTVTLDTIFSRVPSVTKTFWVHNKSGDGIRCSSIRLKNGNQTGFRVNVNGVYLGEKQGYQLADEEIRKGDSIRVFVEVTTPTNNQPVPQLVTDDLVFSLESGVQQSVNLKVWSWDAELLRDVVVSHDTIINSDKPTVIFGDLIVNEGATLTVPAGKTLYFHSGSGMTVNGRLLCKGEPGNEVVLRGDRLDHMFDYLPYDGVSGQWRGIRFTDKSFNNELVFTDLHAACDAVVCDSSQTDRQKLTVQNSTIHNCKGCGIYAENCRITLENSQISNTLSDCLTFIGGITDMNNCTVAQFYPFDASRGSALLFANQTDNVKYADMHLGIMNSVITGYADDVVFASLADSIDCDYSFSHCLLRTPEVKDSVKFQNIIWEDVEDTTVAGWKNFVKVDVDKLQYDFHLKQTSAAVDAADPLTSLPTDRNATLRDEKPDMGCFESEKKEE